MFSLEPEEWYPYQEISDYFRPIYIKKVIPRKTGKNLLGLELTTKHGLERLELRVLLRTEYQLVAAQGGETIVIIHQVGFKWLQRHCSALLSENPLSHEPRYDSDVAFYLDNVFETRINQTVFDSFRDEHIFFRFDDHIFQSDHYKVAQASKLPLVVEAENLSLFWKKAKDRVEFYLPKRPDKEIDIAFEIKVSEDDILIAWALRFDGYKYDDKYKQAVDSANLLKSDTIPEEPLIRMTHFFLLQRYLHKWGGEFEPGHGECWRLFRTLFLLIANEAVPLPYRFSDRYESWLHNFEPLTNECVALIRSLHKGLDYDDKATEKTLPPKWYSQHKDYEIILRSL